VVLTRTFLEFCIWGWDNLPRTVLMYYTNFISSPEGYFHTVICNAQEFQTTSVNHDLHYIKWDTPPKKHPMLLSLKHFDEMMEMMEMIHPILSTTESSHSYLYTMLF